MEIPLRHPNLTRDHRPSAKELARLHAVRRSAVGVQHEPLDPSHLCHTDNRRLHSPVRQSHFNMPRSFLVKNHHNSRKWKHGKLKPKSEELHHDTDEDSLLHSTTAPRQHCPVLNAQLQKAPKAISSCSHSYPVRTQLHLPSSSDAPTLSFLGHCSRTYRESSAQSSAEMNLEIQHVACDSRRRESLQQPSLPLVTILPAVPSNCSNQKRFECLDCHNEHLRFMGLAKHKRPQCEWSSKKYFNCKYCEKEYISLGALKMHIRTHTLPCVCKLCGKAFSRSWLLQGHIRTHTGEKPFSCLHCQRAFADRSNLRAHLQTHSEMKRYQCPCCLKTFSRIPLLAKHQEAGCLLS